MSKSAVAIAAAASKTCLREGLTSWSLGQVLGDLTAALTPGEGGPPNPIETSEGDAQRSDLPEGVAGHRPMAKTTPSKGETCTEGSRSHRRDKCRRRRREHSADGSRGGGLTRGVRR